MVPNHAVLLFLRAPEKGKVKTRLARHLGDRQALAIYVRFVEDTLAMLAETGAPVEIFFHPPQQATMVQNWLGNQYTYRPQSGGNLGEKMARAFVRAFENNCERAVLIGTDIPDLPGSIVRDALDALETHDAVIGPATDGGYYLIGFQSRGFLPETFDDIPWGTPAVFTRTQAVFRKHRIRVHRLPEWLDVDDHHDLMAFARRNTTGKTLARHTAAFIAQQFPSLADIQTDISTDIPKEEENHGNIL